MNGTVGVPSQDSGMAHPDAWQDSSSMVLQPSRMFLGFWLFVMLAVGGIAWGLVLTGAPDDALLIGAVGLWVAAVGAPPEATADATAMLLALSGADISWPMHDVHGVPKDRVPDVIANTVELIVADLRSKVAS